MLDLLQLMIDGLLDGGVYALLGLGLSLTFGCLKRLNLAYGATAMLAAYLGAYLHSRYQISVWGIAVCVIGSAIVIGVYVEQLCFSRTWEGPGQHGGGSGLWTAGTDGREIVALASSFAIWMQLEQLAVNLLPRHLNPFPSLAYEHDWLLPILGGDLMIRLDRLGLAVLGVVMVLGLALWVERSRTGLAWRATADHRMAAYLVGIPVSQAQSVAFAVACGISGLAAFAVLALDGQVTPMFGMWMLLKGLVAAMLGGLGSIRGVLWGGLLLGVIESYFQAWLGAQGREFATYAVLFAVLIRSRWAMSNPAGFAGSVRRIS
jgi:branched-subunit amino acid ABC-type transport system permease component